MSDDESASEVARWTQDIHQGDATETLAEMPANSVDCVVTSPPYWGLRDYQIDEQLGVEEKAAEYIERLMTVMDELQRVLDGSLWLNIGDTYNGCSIIRPDSSSHTDAGDEGYEDQLASNRDESGVKRRSTDQFGVARQSRLFIPERVKIAMAERGWRCRDAVVWTKPSPAPEGRVSSRLTTAHEPIYRFVTGEGAYFDREAVDSPTDVWQMPTASNEHPAPFPTELVRRSVKLTTEPGDVVLDPFCGSGTTCSVAKDLGREFIGIELNPEFVAIGQERVGVTVDEPERLLDDDETSLTAYTDGGDVDE